MPIQATSVLGVIGVIAAMIFVYIQVMPEAKYKSLNPFLRWLSDLFNFRTLWLEAIIKFFYVLSTVVCVVFGFLLLFTNIEYYYYSKSLAPAGLILIIAGPVVMRLLYEGTMMFILLVKNTMEINNRLRNNAPDKKESAEKIEEKVEIKEAAPVEKPVYVQAASQFCPNCGGKISDDTVFCANCGNKVN